MIHLFHLFSPDSLTFMMFLGCFLTLTGAFKFFGSWGLTVYISVAVSAANIQVLKIASLTHFHEPVALGTIVFSSLYIANDFLTEFYGPQAARRAVHLSLGTMIFLSFLMILTIAYDPYPTRPEVQQALETLFLPLPSLTCASFISYWVSQYTNIFIFQTLRLKTQGKKVWLRSATATLISGFLDTVLFSWLAWVVFSPRPITYSTLIWTYILGNYGFQAGTSLLGTPALWLVKKYPQLQFKED